METGLILSTCWMSEQKNNCYYKNKGQICEVQESFCLTKANMQQWAHNVQESSIDLILRIHRGQYKFASKILCMTSTFINKIAHIQTFIQSHSRHNFYDMDAEVDFKKFHEKLGYPVWFPELLTEKLKSVHEQFFFSFWNSIGGGGWLIRIFWSTWSQVMKPKCNMLPQRINLIPWIGRIYCHPTKNK